MNPIMLIAFCVGIFFILMGVILGYLTTEKGKAADCFLLAITGFIIAFLTGVFLATEWERTNHSEKPTQQTENR